MRQFANPIDDIGHCGWQATGSPPYEQVNQWCDQPNDKTYLYTTDDVWCPKGRVAFEVKMPKFVCPRDDLADPANRVWFTVRFDHDSVHPDCEAQVRTKLLQSASTIAVRSDQAEYTEGAEDFDYYLGEDAADGEIDDYRHLRVRVDGCFGCCPIDDDPLPATLIATLVNVGGCDDVDGKQITLVLDTDSDNHSYSPSNSIECGEGQLKIESLYCDETDCGCWWMSLDCNDGHGLEDVCDQNVHCDCEPGELFARFYFAVPWIDCWCCEEDPDFYFDVKRPSSSSS